MIVAAGLTPAWQQILRFDRLLPGEVNRATEATWCASGKVLNVGLALSRLGAESLTIAPLGGLPATAIQREFATLGAPAWWIETTAATRICTTAIDESMSCTTEMVENAAALSPAEVQAFVEAYANVAAKADVVVLTGSLPAGTTTNLYLELLQHTPGRAIVDARGPELLGALNAEPFLTKPNREELARTLQRAIHSDDDLVQGMQELNARGAAWVLVTQGKNSAWLTSPTTVHRLEPLSLAKVVNPIGCGDCLAAGIAWGLQQGCEVIEAARLGIAAAAENARQLLPSRLDPRRVRELAANVRVT